MKLTKLIVDPIDKVKRQESKDKYKKILEDDS